MRKLLLLALFCLVASAGDELAEQLRQSKECQELFGHVIAQHMHGYAPRAEDLPPIPPEKRVLWAFQPGMGENGLMTLSRQDGQRRIETVATRAINAENVADIFTHEYTTGKFGAKGILLNSPLAVETMPTPCLYWRTGVGKQGTEFHHRDAVAAMRRSEAVIWEGAQAVNELAAQGLSMMAGAKFWGARDQAHAMLQTGGLPGETIPQRVRRELTELAEGRSTRSTNGNAVETSLAYSTDLMNADFDNPMTPAKKRDAAKELLATPNGVEAVANLLAMDKTRAEALRKAHQLQAERTLELALVTERLRQEKEADADQKERVRRQDSYTAEDLLAGLGVQMTAQKINGRLRVTHLDIDSSLTASQIAALEKTDGPLASRAARQRLGDILSELVAKAHLSISPDVRGYREIRVYGLKKLQHYGIQVRAPHGFRIVDRDD